MKRIFCLLLLSITFFTSCYEDRFDKFQDEIDLLEEENDRLRNKIENIKQDLEIALVQLEETQNVLDSTEITSSVRNDLTDVQITCIRLLSLATESE